MGSSNGSAAGTGPGSVPGSRAGSAPRSWRVNAFTRDAGGGNPAAVCPLEAWLADAEMQEIARVNGLSETAFFVARPAGAADGAGDGDDERVRDLDLRWFTPAVEVDLCGHATLASAALLFERLAPALERIRFHTLSGTLVVTREQGGYAMDFPLRRPGPAGPAAQDALAAALGRRPVAALRARDLVAVFDTAEEVRALAPDMARVAALDAFAVAVTAPGTGADADVDFVSRFFAPAKGVPEDPVTGSAHTELAPYWAERLGRSALRARQVSARGGEIGCTVGGERVTLWGQVYLDE